MSLTMTFLDVGNGDCIIISESKETAIVIDVPNKRRLEKWLEKHEVRIIESLYFTHAHKDHCPSLVEIITFISGWSKKENAQVIQLFLAGDVLRNAARMVNNGTLTKAEKMLLQDAFDRLDLWCSTGKIKILRAERSLRAPDSFGGLFIDILHPPFVYFEVQNTKQPNSLNETSVVLRISYGAFNALLLADLEGTGISAMLRRYDEQQLKSQLVKIPHHGAWPRNNTELHRLLQLIDPEIAVLSVGSNNPHGHVVPELFSELLSLKNSSAYKLKQFVCTEVTRTCMWDAIRRSAGRHEKLAQKIPCAGDISIIADSSGTWIMKDSGRHAETVDKISYAACRGRLDFGISDHVS